MIDLQLFNQQLAPIEGMPNRFAGDLIRWLRNLVAAISTADDTADTALATADAAVAASCPTGSIIEFAAASAPAGWVLCDGASYLRADATHAALFGVIGTTWGSADSTHFNVPDLRGRATVGAGSGAGLTTRALAATGGEETHQLTAAEIASHVHGVGTLVNANESAHTHGVGSLVAANESAHTHAVGSLVNSTLAAFAHGLSQLKGVASSKITAGGTDNIVTTTSGTALSQTTDTAGSHTHTISGATAAGSAHTHTLSGSVAAGSAHTHAISGSTGSLGSDTAHNNMQPFAAVNRIIKL